MEIAGADIEGCRKRGKRGSYFVEWGAVSISQSAYYCCPQCTHQNDRNTVTYIIPEAVVYLASTVGNKFHWNNVLVVDNCKGEKDTEGHGKRGEGKRQIEK